MRKRSPEALYCCTTASNSGISPGRAPMPMCSAETEPSARAGVAASAPRAKTNVSALNTRVNSCNLNMQSFQPTRDTCNSRWRPYWRRCHFATTSPALSPHCSAESVRCFREAQSGRGADPAPVVVSFDDRASLSTFHFNAAVGCDVYDLLGRDIGLDELPHRRSLDPLVHARPAGDDIVLAGINGFARLEVRHVENPATHRPADVDRVAETTAANHVTALLVIGVGIEKIVGDILENVFQVCA